MSLRQTLEYPPLHQTKADAAAMELEHSESLLHCVDDRRLVIVAKWLGPPPLSATVHPKNDGQLQREHLKHELRIEREGAPDPDGRRPPRMHEIDQQPSS